MAQSCWLDPSQSLEVLMSCLSLMSQTDMLSGSAEYCYFDIQLQNGF